MVHNESEVCYVASQDEEVPLLTYQMPIPTEADSELDWLIKLRKFVSIAELCALVPGYLLGIATGPRFWLYLGLFLLNPCVNFGLSRLKKAKPRFVEKYKNVLLLASLVFDAGHLFVLLALTGGWNNPFALILPLYAALGGLILRQQMAIGYCCYLAVLVTVLIHYFSGPISLNYPWAQNVVNFFVVLFLMAILVFLSLSLVERIVAREKAYNSLAQEKLRLTRLRAIGALSSGVCHQLASPLNNLKLRLKRLHRALPANSDIKSMYKSLEKSEVALRKLADIQLNSRQFSVEPVDCRELLLEVVSKWQEDNDNKVVVEAPWGYVISVPIIGFVQAIMDLLDNSKEASPVGATIGVEVEKVGHYCSIHVVDSGDGFPDSTLAYIGQPFNSHKEAGSGLGLYHADIICQLLGGKLAAANLPEGGSRVTLKFLAKGVSVGRKNFPEPVGAYS